MVKIGNFGPFDSKMEWFSGSRMSCRSGIPVQSFLGFLPTYLSGEAKISGDYWPGVGFKRHTSGKIWDFLSI